MHAEPLKSIEEHDSTTMSAEERGERGDPREKTEPATGKRVCMLEPSNVWERCDALAGGRGPRRPRSRAELRAPALSVKEEY